MLEGAINLALNQTRCDQQLNQTKPDSARATEKGIGTIGFVFSYRAIWVDIRGTYSPGRWNSAVSVTSKGILGIHKWAVTLGLHGQILFKDAVKKPLRILFNFEVFASFCNVF